MSEQVLKNYQDFVEAVTSNDSNSIDAMIQRLEELKALETDVNISLLLTAAIGLADEGGELLGIVKKILFHGKPLNEENITHMQLELSDIFWYLINGCRALNIDPYEVIEKNVKKLESRYPSGSFNIYDAENRKAGDI